jgi:hypothetical protein
VPIKTFQSKVPIDSMTSRNSVSGFLLHIHIQWHIQMSINRSETLEFL